MWYIEFVIGNKLRQFTERDPGEALRKIYEEFGVIQGECVHNYNIPIRLSILTKLDS